MHASSYYSQRESSENSPDDSQAQTRPTYPAEGENALRACSRGFLERSILFWDTLRQRTEDLMEHERQGSPPLLDFRFETIVDARQFERPVNYVLLRIRHDHVAADLPGDDTKPPVLIMDPRAGHGPGIGGFKQDSEVGVALADGDGRSRQMASPDADEPLPVFDVLLALAARPTRPCEIDPR
jgi:hypothetical protein